MLSDPVAKRRLHLLVLRVMDSDLLLPEDASALLAEIEEAELVETELSERELLIQSLEALVRTDRLGDPAGARVPEIVRRILHGDDPV